MNNCGVRRIGARLNGAVLAERSAVVIHRSTNDISGNVPDTVGRAPQPPLHSNNLFSEKEKRKTARRVQPLNVYHGRADCVAGCDSMSCGHHANKKSFAQLFQKLA